MGLLHKIALGAAGTLLGIATLAPRTLDDVVLAQDAKPMADTTKDDTHKIALNPYQQFSQNFYAVGNDFYKKAKDRDKALEALSIAAYFDSTNKNVSDLIQTVEKSKLKKNEKEAKKVDEQYGKTKQEAIDTLYKSAVEKLPTDKTGAFKDFEGIWKVDDKSVKPYEALGFVKNENGIYVPRWMKDNRDVGKKFLDEATEGEEDQTESDLEGVLGAKQVFKRKGGNIYTRSTVSEKNAKQLYKDADAAINYFKAFTGIEGWVLPGSLLSAEDQKQIKNEGGNILIRLTELKDVDEFTNYAKKIAGDNNPLKGGTGSEDWQPWSRTSEKDTKKLHSGKFYQYSEGVIDDKTIHNVIEKILIRTSAYGMKSFNKDLPWFVQGFADVVSAEMTGKTSVIKLHKYDDKYEGEKIKLSSTDTPEAMRAIAYDVITSGKALPLQEIVRRDEKTYTLSDRALMFGFAEYLKTEHKDALKRTLIDGYTGTWANYELTGEELLAKAFKLEDIKKFEAGWHDWVKTEYSGYRAIQN